MWRFRHFCSLHGKQKDAFVQPGGQTLKLKLNLPIFLFKTNFDLSSIEHFCTSGSNQPSLIRFGRARKENIFVLSFLFMPKKYWLDSLTVKTRNTDSRQKHNVRVQQYIVVSTVHVFIHIFHTIFQRRKPVTVKFRNHLL